MRAALKPLSEQVIVITGASSGIGRSTARAAAHAGAKVMLAARNEEAVRKAQLMINAAGGTAAYAVADVSKREDIEALADATVELYGRFDTWVNDAGVGIIGKVARVSEADHRHLFETNFWGLANGSLIAADYLKRFGGGAIVNLGSMVSDVGFPIQGLDGVSKHAVKGFTDAFRMELAAEGAPISVILIKPTSIDAPFTLNARNRPDQHKICCLIVFPCSAYVDRSLKCP
jgi:NAD(P)-dependent dehydrogenase (short-subunit alcohol dehydrogenase family)